MPDDDSSDRLPSATGTTTSSWFPPGAGSPTKLAPPRLDDQVERSGLLSWYSGLPGTRVVVLAAPAGYGKTTVLHQWFAADERSTAWLTLDAGDNDPALLLGYLVAALRPAGRIDDTILSGPLSESVFFDQVALPRFAKALRSLGTPVFLALDDVQSIESAAAWRLLALTSDNLPTGSVTVLCGRTAPSASVFPPGADDAVARIGKAELAFSLSEASALLNRLGLDLPPTEVAKLLLKTEGWPAALYLAGLSLQTRSDLEKAIDEFSGSSAIVVDYLRDEFLSRSPPDLVRFLTRTAVLDRLSGPLCDAVLNARDSSAVLVRVSEGNALLSPLDGSNGWFRYHQLFAEMLRAELRRLEPQLEPVLHARASAWFEMNGDTSAAVTHALAAEDPRHAAEVLWASAPGHITTGWRATVERLLAAFDAHALVTDPLLALTSAWCAVSAGEPVEPWLVTAELALDRAERPVTKGFSAVGAVAILRAILGTDGAGRMAEDAQRAYEHEAQESPGRPFACYLAGVAHHLCGNPDAASQWLESGRDLARQRRTLTVLALSTAQLGLIAAQEEDWPRCERLVREATEVVRSRRLDDFATMAPVFAVSALQLAHNRRLVEAREAATQAQRLLAATGAVRTWLVEAHIVLARAELLLGEPASAARLVTEAESYLARTPEATLLQKQVADLRALLRTPTLDGGVSAPRLTKAEERVVQMLSTHLSFAEIALELEVSKNTVKTQAISAYRKLGVSSRSAAVEAARAQGLAD